MINLKKISKVYDSNKKTILKELSLTIEQGEAICFVGDSGAGKTTLLDILGMLQQPTTGKYYFKNSDISKLSLNQLAKLRNKSIGFIFQSFNLLNNYTILENVMLPLHYSNLNIKEKRKKALESIEKMGLNTLYNQKAKYLSGGQQQRVAIARAIVNSADIIIADEPTGNLDLKNSIKVQKELVSLWREGKTIITVTHDLNIAKKYPKIFNIKNGSLVKIKKI